MRQARQWEAGRATRRRRRSRARRWQGWGQLGRGGRTPGERARRRGGVAKAARAWHDTDSPPGPGKPIVAQHGVPFLWALANWQASPAQPAPPAPLQALVLPAQWPRSPPLSASAGCSPEKPLCSAQQAQQAQRGASKRASAFLARQDPSARLRPRLSAGCPGELRCRRPGCPRVLTSWRKAWRQHPPGLKGRGAAAR